MSCSLGMLISIIVICVCAALPKFEVKVKLPSYYHKDMGSLKGKVEAK